VPRARGAIRTHLGRKRSGARGRGRSALECRRPGELDRRDQEDLFDRLLGRFQSFFDAAGERTAATFDGALDRACDTLVAAGEFTAENAERLRQFLRRDLLHRDHPAMTFRTGDITTAGTVTCESCGWTIQTTRTTLLPACPQCAETTYRKTG
jgi:isocitrate dehydrogenase